MTNLFTPLTISVTFVCCAVSCSAQATEKRSQKSIVTVFPYNFKSRSLKGKVDEAIQQGRQGISGPMRQLMKTYKGDSHDILRFVKSYARNSDTEVRLTVLDAVSLAPIDKNSMEIIVQLAPDPSIGHLAIDILYNKLNQTQVVERGGNSLKRSLFAGAFKSRYTTRGYLLLACYKSDAAVTKFLKRRRESFHKTPGVESEKVSLDLALSNIGDTDATKRVGKVLAGKNTPEILAFLRYLKFVNNKAILLKSLELLRNKNRANEVRSVEEDLLASSRICDEALVVLSEKAGLPQSKVSSHPDLAPRFDDTTLTQNYNLLKLKFADNDGNTRKR